LPGTAPADIDIHIRIRTVDPDEAPDPPPYLLTVGSPGLRFAEPPAIPPPRLRADASAPPLPHLPSPDQADLALGGVAPPDATGAKPTAPKPAPISTKEDEPPPPSAASIKILPDTIRPQVQAEDFLPYFVVPDAVKSNSTVPVPPAPGKLPPSSATYNETK